MTHPDCFKFCFRHQQDCHRPARSVAPTAASSRTENSPESGPGNGALGAIAIRKLGGKKNADTPSLTSSEDAHLLDPEAPYVSLTAETPDFTALHKLHTASRHRHQPHETSHRDERESASSANSVRTPNVSAGVTPSPESDRPGPKDDDERSETNPSANGATESYSHVVERPTEAQPVEGNRERGDTAEQTPIAAAIPRAKGSSETGIGHQAPDTLVVDSGDERSATATSHTELGGTHLIAATGTYASCDTHNPDFTRLHKVHKLHRARQTREQLAEVPAGRRHDYILQRRMRFEPTLATPQGMTQIEIRIMYLWRKRGLEMVNVILRTGRGKMMGVDHNKGLDWVGASAAFLVDVPTEGH